MSIAAACFTINTHGIHSSFTEHGFPEGQGRTVAVEGMVLYTLNVHCDNTIKHKQTVMILD